MAEQLGETAPFKNAPMLRDDKEVVALQAADLLAWWARKNWIEHGTFDNQKWQFPWEESTPGPDYLFVEVDEERIRKHLLNTIYDDFARFFTGASERMTFSNPFWAPSSVSSASASRAASMNRSGWGFSSGFGFLAGMGASLNKKGCYYD